MKCTYSNISLAKDINDYTNYYIDVLDSHRNLYIFYDEYNKRILLDNKLKDEDRLIYGDEFLKLVKKDYPLKENKNEKLDYRQWMVDSAPLENIKFIDEQITKKENKMNYEKQENYENCIIKVFAPGAAKNNTKIRIDHSINGLLVEVKPNINFGNVDLEVNEKFIIDKKYNLKEVNANIAMGIVTIKIPVDTEVIQTVEID